VKVEFEIADKYFDEAARAECRVVFLGLVHPNQKTVTAFICAMSPVDYQEVRDDLMAKFTAGGGEEF
jgi:hypothetical protein